ncbi:MAG TPA: family 16 glycosylhydrolase [Tepidisphaeraceae bacterium]|jgi:autotransporter-associated beta strand protein
MKPVSRILISSLVVAPGIVTIAQAAPTGYKMIWADEFNGTSLDTMKWGYNYSWGRTHNHAAYMRESQVIVGNGALNLQAIKKRDANAVDKWVDGFGWQTMDYTSGAVHTNGLLNLTGGYVEARMKVDDVIGSWPAFWMLQGGWPPEIDIMEFPRGAGNNNQQYWANYHYTNAANAHASYGWQDNKGVNLSAGFHTYGMEWTGTAMRFFFDGAVTHTITDAAAIADAAGMYLILNHAVGGWAGAPEAASFPADFLIDYVRVWQKPTDTAAAITWAGTTASASWDTAANWSSSVPKFDGQIARFGANAQSAVNVTWGDLRAVGGLSFDGSTAYTLGNGGGLTLMNSAGPASIVVDATATADQTIAARVEAYSNVIINNNSTKTLSFTGVITGEGDLTIDGPGTVHFSNNNTYTGDTYIDSGTQGAAVARVDRSRPFGSIGTVYFNPAGNNTSGRIEILGNRSVPNNVMLSGRNNATVAIQNIADNNVFSGTISATSGGGNYLIQSDAGRLELSGTETAAGGIALRAEAVGGRTFTLGGTGAGLVSGRIVDGNGVVGITKSGDGTWTLGGANAYTGATNVNAGKLVVNGTQTGGNYRVAPGATLGGGGTIDPVTGADVRISGILAPGNSIGTLTVGSTVSPNTLAIATGGTLLAEIGAAGAADLLAINGTLDLSAAGDVLSLVGLTGAFDGSTYTLATFTPGTLGAGRFDALLLNGAAIDDAFTVGSRAYELQYADASGLVQLVAVPEPTSMAALVLAAGALGRRRRRIA